MCKGKRSPNYSRNFYPDAIRDAAGHHCKTDSVCRSFYFGVNYRSICGSVRRATEIRIIDGHGARQSTPLVNLIFELDGVGMPRSGRKHEKECG